MEMRTALHILTVLAHLVNSALGHTTPVLTGEAIFEGDHVEGPLPYFENSNVFRINTKVNVDSPLSDHGQLEITCKMKTAFKNETTLYTQVQKMKGKYQVKDIKGEDVYKKQFSFTGSFSTRSGFTAYRKCEAELRFMNPHTHREQLKSLQLIDGWRKYKFVESLVAEYSKWIEEWFPAKTFNLLFKSGPSFTHQTFHASVDGKGPTVILAVEALTGVLYGAFTSKPWGGSVHRQDPEAFLFRINCAAPECKAKKYAVNGVGKNVIHDGSNEFPYFGHQEFAFDGCRFSLKPKTGFQLTENLGCFGEWKYVEVYSVQ